MSNLIVTFHTGSKSAPRCLALAGDDRKIYIWNLDHFGAKPLVFPGAKSRTNALAFFPDGRRLAAGDDDYPSPVRVFDLDKPEAEPRHLDGHKGPVRDLAVSPDGRRLAVLGERGAVRVWDIEKKASVPVELTGGDRSLVDIAFNSAGELVAAGNSGEPARARADLESGAVELAGPAARNRPRPRRRLGLRPEG